MRKRLLFLLGLILLGTLTYFCFQDKADTIRHELKSKADDILVNNNLDNAKAKLIGKGLETTTIMKIIGEAPSVEVKEEVAHSIGALSGISAIDNQLTVNQVEVVENLPPKPAIKQVEAIVPSPYLFDASKDKNGTVVLSGYVDSSDSHKALLDRADKIFGVNNITDNIQIAKGAPKNWNSVIYLGLKKLQDVDYGDLKLHDTNYAFNGRISSPEAEKIKMDILKETNTTMAKYSEYAGNFEINIPEPQPVARKELKVKSAKQCQKALMAISKDQKILFEYNSAVIKKDSTQALDKIVKTLKECNFDAIKSLEIGGHTDSIGNYGFNKKLSQKRADNVKTYLIKHGISKDKLISHGYGERKPIVSNMLKAGRAKNRRIEFTIKGVK